MASSAEQPLISVRQLAKRFGDFQALVDINLDIRRSQTLCVIGPSGSGKSTLLRCLNFLEPYDDAGEVRMDGTLIGWREGGEQKRRPLKPAALRAQRRRIGMVFQQFNLWPHFTALGNVMEALVQVLRLPREQARARAEAALDKVNLGDKAEQWPATLSGGQQQRVAIARAIAMEPDVMLFDEPTSALDPELVGEVLSVIKTLAAEGTTLVVATHEMGFAAHVADRVAFLEAGRLVACEPPGEMFGPRPPDPRIRSFIQSYRERNTI